MWIVYNLNFVIFKNILNRFCDFKIMTIFLLLLEYFPPAEKQSFFFFRVKKPILHIPKNIRKTRRAAQQSDNSQLQIQFIFIIKLFLHYQK